MIPKQQRQEPNDLVEIILYVIGVACLVFMLAGIISSCVFGANETIEPDQEQLVDSCELQDIDWPDFRAWWSICRFDTVPEYALVSWYEYSDYWVKDYVEVRPLRDVVKDIVGIYITFDSMIIIDHSRIENGMLIVDCWFAFRNPGGSWTPQGLGQGLQIRMPGYVSSKGFALSPENTMRIGTLTNYSAQESADVIYALPGLEFFSMRYTNLDSTGKTIVYDALLSGCKCCFTVDTTGLDMPESYIEQFNYQQIILN